MTIIARSPEQKKLEVIEAVAALARERLPAAQAGGSRPSSAGTMPACRPRTCEREVPDLYGAALAHGVAVKWLGTAVTDLLKEFWVTVEDLRRVAFHQANGRLLATMLDASALLPTRCIRCWNGAARPYPRRCRLRWTMPCGKGRWRPAISSCWGGLAAVSRGAPASSVGDIAHVAGDQLDWRPQGIRTNPRQASGMK